MSHHLATVFLLNLKLRFFQGLDTTVNYKLKPWNCTPAKRHQLLIALQASAAVLLLTSLLLIAFAA